eukprot:SAG31_NODE_32039_length_361_cov_0.522901_1_plen_43_part_00
MSKTNDGGRVVKMLFVAKLTPRVDSDGAQVFKIAISYSSVDP